jgi:Domain of unknown function (DUF4352)
MPKRLVPIGTVFILLLLLACGGTSSSGQTVVPATSGSTGATQPASIGTSGPTQPAAADTPAPAAPAVAKIGDRVELNGMALTVVKADHAAELGGIMKAKAGNEFIVTEVIIENTGSEKLSYNLLYFKARDSEGFEYSTALGMDQPLSAGELAKGEKARGNVAFEVKQGAKGLILEYKPLTLGGSEAIKVALN